MLTKEDFRQNLQIISVACKLRIFPLELNPHTQRMQLLENKRARVVSYIYFALYTIHTAYIVLRLPYLLLTGKELSILSLVVHFTMICGMMAIAFWQFTSFFRFPGITATCFNKALETWDLVATNGTLKLTNATLF